MSTTYTTQQAADALGISPHTLKAQRRNGRITGTLVQHPVANYYLYTEAELDRYRREQLGRPGTRKGTPRRRRQASAATATPEETAQ
jgi:DNA-binding transcriptional MerR regulator